MTHDLASTRWCWLMRWLRLSLWLWIALLAACPSSGHAPGPTQPSFAATVAIDQTGLLLPEVGRTAQLSASMRDATGATISGDIAWTSNRPEVVSVDPDGLVTARADGSAQVVATSGGLVSPPLLVVVTTPADGVLTVADDQVDGLPEESDPGATPSRRNTYRVTLAASTALPAIGARLVGTGSIPLAGEVTAVDSGSRRVTLRPVPLRELLPELHIDEELDLSKVEPIFPPELLATYQITKVGDRYDFTPKLESAGGMAARKRSFAARGTSVAPVFPFEECAASLGGLEDGKLPLELSVPPSFSFSLPAAIEVRNTSAHGLERIVLKGKPQFAVSTGLKLTAAINGSISCKVTLAEIPIPVGGPVSWLIGGIVPVGVGAELAGAVTFSTMGLTLSSTTAADVELGLDCAKDACTFVREFSNFTNANQRTVDLPSVGDFRVDVSAGIFGFADLEFGTTRAARYAPGFIADMLRSLRVRIASAKISGKMNISAAPRFVQVEDPDYKSNYNAVIEVKAGLGTEAEGSPESSSTTLAEIAELVGVSAINALELSTTIDVARSPTGTATADRTTFLAGDEVHFSSTLDNVTQILGGAYNVSRVLLVRRVPGGTEVVAHVDAADGQRDFEFTYLPSGPGRTDEFYIFVTTRALNFALLEAAELFPFEIDRVRGNPDPALQIVTSSLPQALVGSFYTASLQASGGREPYSWSATALPVGLAIDPTTGTISGTTSGPPGPYSVTVTVRSFDGIEAHAALVLQVVADLTGTWNGSLTVNYDLQLEYPGVSTETTQLSALIHFQIVVQRDSLGILRTTSRTVSIEGSGSSVRTSVGGSTHYSYTCDPPTGGVSAVVEGDTALRMTGGVTIRGYETVIPGSRCDAFRRGILPPGYRGGAEISTGDLLSAVARIDRGESSTEYQIDRTSPELAALGGKDVARYRLSWSLASSP